MPSDILNYYYKVSSELAIKQIPSSTEKVGGPCAFYAVDFAKSTEANIPVCVIPPLVVLRLL